MKYLKTILIIFILTINYCLAADIQFTAQANRTRIGVGENFQVSFTINASASEFRAPTFSDFRVLSGPNQSTSVQIINGNYSQSLTLSYILSPIKEGKFKIKPASIKVGSKSIESNEISIEVIKGQAQAQTQQNQRAQNQQNQGQEAKSNNSSDDIFLKVSVDKTKAFIGEQINATYKVYYRVNIQQYNVNKIPALTGFWSQDIDKPVAESNSYTENVNGIVYHVSEIKKTILFPQRAGSLLLDPLEMDFVIQRQSNRRAQNIFDQFFGTVENVKYSLKSQSVKIEILPVPEINKPKSFAGAVGNYTIESKVDKNKVKANEAINLTINISGKGNLKLLETPKPVFPSDFESYDAKISEKVATNESGVSGTITYEYLIIPRHSGTFILDPIPFSFFNPQTKQFKDLNTSAIEISVEKGESEEAQVYSGTDKEEVKLLANDIQYIKTELNQINPIGKYFFRSVSYYILGILPVIIFIVFLIFWLQYKEKSADKNWLKSNKAKKTAIKKLSIAKKHLENNEEKLLYEEIFRALYGYLSDKLFIPVSELSKEKISENLVERNISKDTVDQLIKTLDYCEYARYAPTSIVSKSEIYKNAEEIVIIIEEAIDSKKHKSVVA